MQTVIIGAQWGDEGKGKIVDYLAKRVDSVVRFNGGNNAGHTIVRNGEKFALSLLPSGVLYKKKLFLSQAVVINPKVLLSEIDFFKKRGMTPTLTIDPRCNIVMPYHQILDEATELAKGKKKTGSLKLGIGYCYEDRNNRQGIRFEDLIDRKLLKEKICSEFPLKKKRIEAVFGYKVDLSMEEIFEEFARYGKKLSGYIGDVSKAIHDGWKRDRILFEGAHGTFLDANFGTYPYTTAVNTISGSVFPYVGIPAEKINVLGIVKAYTTRVGGGPFPTELFDTVGTAIREKGGEFGTVSKRPRRIGWLDLPMLRLSHRLNGFSKLIVTKIDVLSGIKSLKVAEYYLLGSKKLYEMPSKLSEIERVTPVYKEFEGWEDASRTPKRFLSLPKQCRQYVKFIEERLNVPVRYLSTGAERSAIISV